MSRQDIRRGPTSPGGTVESLADLLFHRCGDNQPTRADDLNSHYGAPARSVNRAALAGARPARSRSADGSTTLEIPRCCCGSRVRSCGDSPRGSSWHCCSRHHHATHVRPSTQRSPRPSDKMLSQKTDAAASQRCPRARHVRSSSADGGECSRPRVLPRRNRLAFVSAAGASAGHFRGPAADAPETLDSQEIARRPPLAR